MNSPCPYCQHPSFLLFRAQDYNRQIGNDLFTYFCCNNCRLLFLDPVPDNLNPYYPKDYYYLPQTLEELSINAEHENYKIEIVKSFLKSGKILEIGPGGCGFAYLAKKEGFEIETLEMDSRVAAFLNNVVKIPTYNASDSSAIPQKQQYNMIALWHVIEHVREPFKMLKEISKLLLPGGFILIAAPNPNAWQFKIFKHLWTHVDAPRHLFLIPQDLLSHFMTDLAFKTLLSTTTDEGGLGWNSFGWQRSLSNHMKSRLGKITTSMVGKIASAFTKPIEKKEGTGSCYTMVFQKTDNP